MPIWSPAATSLGGMGSIFSENREASLVFSAQIHRARECAAPGSFPEDRRGFPYTMAPSEQSAFSRSETPSSRGKHGGSTGQTESDLP
jgi:hypothetical protein